MSLKKQALSGVFWTFVQQFGVQGIGFVINIVLARLLTPQQFGLIAMITVFVGIGNALLNAGMGSSLIRSKNLDNADYSTVFFFNLIASIFIYALIWISAPAIARFYHQPVLIDLIRWLSLVIIINAFALIQQTRLTKQMDFKTQAGVAIPAIFIAGAIGIAMAYYGFGVWSLIGFNLAKAFFNALFLWLKSGWIPALVFHWEKFKTHFNFGYKLTISGILDTVFTNIYRIVIGKYFQTAQVGYYDRAKNLNMYPVRTLSAILSKVTYPLFAQIQDDNARLRQVYRKILQMNIYVLAPVLITAGVLAVPLFRFLLTDKWLPAVPYFQIIIITGILYPVHAFNLNILKVKGKSGLFLQLELVKKAIVIAAIFIGIRYGIYGLLWSSVATSIISFFINTHYSGRLIQYTAWQQLKDIIIILLLALISGIITGLTDHYFFKNLNDFWRLLVGGSISILLYLCLSYLLRLAPFKELTGIIKPYLKK